MPVAASSELLTVMLMVPEDDAVPSVTVYVKESEPVKLASGTYLIIRTVIAAIPPRSAPGVYSGLVCNNL